MVVEAYDGSDKYFMENCTTLIGVKGKRIFHREPDEILSYCFTVHYKANYGEILILTWYVDSYVYYHEHFHTKMIWTEGDIWIGIMEISPGDELMYRYEVCVDHGGPIIRKEDTYRKITNRFIRNHLQHDVWNVHFPLKLEQ